MKELIYQPFTFSLEETLEMFKNEENKIGELTAGHYMVNREWVDSELDNLNAWWLSVGGNSGVIHNYGSRQNFPSYEERMEMMEEKQEYIFTWCQPIISGEMNIPLNKFQ